MTGTAAVPMLVPAFSTSFLPLHLQAAGPRFFSQSDVHCPSRFVACRLGAPGPVPKKRIELPSIAAGLTALSLLFAKPPVRACALASIQPQLSFAGERSSGQFATRSSAVAVRPRCPSSRHSQTTRGLDVDGESSLMSLEGTLLRIDPESLDGSTISDAVADAAEGHVPINIVPSQGNVSNYPASPNTVGSLHGMAAARVHRTVRAPDRLLRFRGRVRPSTLGLVGVGAFTSGSVFLRSLTSRSSEMSENESSSVDLPDCKPSGPCSVVCMQIPFCVPERLQLLAELARLADTACLVTRDGMSTAARDAASLLLEESGLMEDSRKFAPHMDVFLADTILSAERRFSAHVAIEGNRLERLCGKNVGYQLSPTANMGQYGVVTLVVATTEGVDLACYDGRVTVVKRLRAALDAICRLDAGDVAGMELRWVPETTESRSLTRAQLADAFPSLRVA